MGRAVVRGRLAKAHALPEHLGVDEKAIAKGHRYMTLVCDLKAGSVEYVGEERTEESLRTLWDYTSRGWPSASGVAGTSGPPTVGSHR